MLSIGIDVSKGRSTVCMMQATGKIIQPIFEVNHTQEEMELLCQKLAEYQLQIRILLEATGTYHLPILVKLKEHGFFVSVINPLLMKKYTSVSIRKVKTDKIDAKKIASYGIAAWHELQDFQATDDIYDELKWLGRQYAHYMKIRISNKLSLSGILERTMPGIKSLLESKNPEKPSKDKLADFTAYYWHYDNITKLSEEVFISDYLKWAKEKGYQASATKAKSIYQAARTGIPTLKSNAASTKMMTLEAIKGLRTTNETLELILSKMKELASTIPEYNTVHAMNGVGTVLSLRLIAEIGDVRRFRNGSALVAYAGIDAPPFESGCFVGTRRNISKRGSSLLRKTGYEAMKCLKTIKPKQDAAVYDFMIKKENEGKPKKVAKIAAFNKFLRIYYARVKEVYIME